MKKIEKINYREYTIYALPEHLSLGKQFLDKKYSTLEVYKNTKRNYVSKIEIKNKNYVLKKPCSEQILLQKKILSVIKKPEVLKTLENITMAVYDYKFKELVIPYVAIIRKKIILKESYLIMEAVVGSPFHISGNLEQLMTWIYSFHQAGFYHKDLNTSNILIQDSNIRVFDTLAKREHWSYFHRYYDLLTLKQDQIVLNTNFHVESYYPIKKFLSWYLALFIKWLKYNPISLFLRERKHKKREH